jgi:MFS family permease
MSVVLIAPLAWRMLAVMPPPADASRDSTSDLEVHDSRNWTTGQILGNKVFWLIVSPFIAIVLAFGGVQYNLGAYSKDLGFDPRQAALLVSLVSIGMITGKLFYGALSDRLALYKLLLISVMVLSFALICFLGSPTVWRMGTGATCMGFSLGGMLPLSAMLISKHFGSASFGKVLGLFSMFMQVSSTGPLISGRIHDTTGSYDPAFKFFLLLMIPSALVILKLGKIEPDQQLDKPGKQSRTVRD